MQSITKRIKLAGILLLLSICLHTHTKAQTPADDPGGPGSGSGGGTPSGDGSPIVPFDGGMSLLLLASGIGYASKKVKTQNMALGLGEQILITETCSIRIKNKEVDEYIHQPLIM